MAARVNRLRRALHGGVVAYVCAFAAIGYTFAQSQKFNARSDRQDRRIVQLTKDGDRQAARRASEIQAQRKESISLLCDMNGVLKRFIAAPPDYPRDEAALKRLRAERCERLLDQFKSRAPHQGK